MRPKRTPDPFAAAVYGPSSQSRRADKWRRWRRIGPPIAVAVAIVVVAAVVTDLPTHASLAAQRSAAASLLTEVNNDVNPCAFGIEEANTIYRELRRGSLSAGDRGRVPSLLGDDSAACSFTSDNINDLADIEEPGTGAGKWLSEVVSLTQSWTTSDALGAINDLSELTSNPHDVAAARDLAGRQRFLDADRHAALAAMAAATHYLEGSLPALKLPAITLPS